nr:uncharacterized mitochondrial protein AtMg00810-like [Tanacetum cinerariifolium]
MDKEKALLKDSDGDDVDVHLYRSMIGSLMYLTSSRPDIMFDGQPKLGLWYPRDSSFDFVAYTNSVYTGASLDRKSTSRGCQFLGCRLISWQCKKQTMVATSTTGAEYVAAASCCGQVLWIQNQLLDYGRSIINMVEFDIGQEDDKVCSSQMKTLQWKIKLNATVDGQDKTITEASVMRHLNLADADGTSTLPTTEIFKQLALMGKTRTRTRRMGHRIPQFNVPSSVADEAITKEMHDGLGWATNTASSLEAEQGSGNISKTQTKATPFGPSSPRTSLEGGPECHKKEMIQISFDEEIAQRFYEEEQAQLLMDKEYAQQVQVQWVSDEARIAQENLAQAEEWDDVQVQIQADEDLAQRMLEEEKDIRKFVLMESEGQITESKVEEGSSKEGESLKRPAEEELGQEQQKKQKGQEDLSQKRLQQMMVIILEKGIHVEALQTKFCEIIEFGQGSNPTEDKEIALWVELKRLFEPDEDEKEYALSRGALLMMLVQKLEVDEHNEMAEELLRKIFMQAKRPRK